MGDLILKQFKLFFQETKRSVLIARFGLLHLQAKLIYPNLILSKQLYLFSFLF
jgi:hypothetical protein